MSQTTKKMMSLELEFIEPAAHGFISWVDYNTGLPVATLGLGSTAQDTGEDTEGNIIGVDNGGQKFLEWNLTGVDYIKVTGGGIQFDEQRSLSIDGVHDVITIDEYGTEIETPTSYIPSQIQLNAADYTTIEKANIIWPFNPPAPNDDGDLEEQPQSDEYTFLDNIKTTYADNTNAMIFEHENSIIFSNPVSNRLMGEIDMVNEAFIWYGAFSLGSVVDDSMFEINRTNPEKYNLTINADVDNNPEIAFKEEDVVTWSISVDTNLIIKNTVGNGLEISDTAATFTGEIIYNGQPLVDYFYEKSALDNGTLDTRYYIKSEIDTLIAEAEERIRENIVNELNPKIEEVIDLVSSIPTYYIYSGNWTKIEYTIIDEEYDLPGAAMEDTIYYAEKEDTFHRYDIAFNELIVEDIQNKNFPKILTTDDYALVEETDSIYHWSNGWEEVALFESDIYTTVQHKSNIITDGVYKIESTGKYYKYETNSFTEIDNPLPYYFDESSLPAQFNFDTIVKNTFIS